MERYTDLYSQIYRMDNLILAWRKARKRKAKRQDVISFERDLIKNLYSLHCELKDNIYQPRPLETFILRDPKTRKISKSDFRDRIVHHALLNIIGNIFEKQFIFDSCAGRKGKGTLFALKRFQYFIRKVSKNYKNINNRFYAHNNITGYCLKADIKHYFDEIDHNILLEIIKRKIKDIDVLALIEKIVANFRMQRERDITKKGMPLGNLTSQFFANVYLNELDYFIKHELKVKYYIRYVDDFVLAYYSKLQLQIWKEKIDNFLRERLKLELHLNKSKIIPLSRGVDFVGFRNFAHFRLLRKRNIRKIERKVNLFIKKEKSFQSLQDSYLGWQGYARIGNTYSLREKIKRKIINIVWDRIELN